MALTGLVTQFNEKIYQFEIQEAESRGICNETLRSRVGSGWSKKSAIETPKRKYSKYCPFWGYLRDKNSVPYQTWVDRVLHAEMSYWDATSPYHRKRPGHTYCPFWGYLRDKNRISGPTWLYRVKKRQMSYWDAATAPLTDPYKRI